MDETWKSDLERWLTPFLSAFRHKARARMCPVYVAELIGARDRTSVQPMTARDGEVGYDQLHHFIASGVWDAAPLEKANYALTPRRSGASASTRKLKWPPPNENGRRRRPNGYAAPGSTAS